VFVTKEYGVQKVQKKTVFFNGRASVGEVVKHECERRYDVKFEEATIVVSPNCFELL
jgi:hypothetical protein